MAGEGEEVAVQRADVHRYLPYRLGGVHQDEGTGGVGHPGQLGDGQELAGAVADVAEGQEAGAGPHLGGETLQHLLRREGGVQDDRPDDDAAASLGVEDGDGHGGVLHRGGDHLVPGAQV